MLVVKLEAVYFKKAVGKTLFTCADGDKLKAAIAQAIDTGEGVTCTVTSSGMNEENEKIADFYITWSFKKRSGRQA